MASYNYRSPKKDDDEQVLILPTSNDQLFFKKILFLKLFFYLQCSLGWYFFGKRKFSGKAALKMLVKLTKERQ